jgi:phosphoenolpyruvate carboxykinase (GTP)
VVRRDPMAMLPFLGYNAGDYLAHWAALGQRPDADRLPAVFYVNWFRRGADGGFLWPGFGENSRVLKWVVDRLEGDTGAVETPIGLVPEPGGLDIDGLDVTDGELAAALAVDPAEWRAELPLIREWFAGLGDRVPASLQRQLELLEAGLRG